MLPLSTAARNKTRHVQTIKLRMPSEKLVSQCKQQLAATHGTQTASFTLPPAEKGKSERVGAYVTDPLRLVRLVSSCSPFVAVGGDKGSDWTKLGVTYSHQNKQKFVPLLVFEGSNHYAGLNELRTPNLTPFSNDSSHYAHIFAVLQQIIDSTPRSFLNDDWLFISAILAHRGSSAFYPCPICIMERSYRRCTDGNLLHPPRMQTPLLTIPSDRIVPTPLHLYLGINNRIIFEAFKSSAAADHSGLQMQAFALLSRTEAMMDE